MRCAENERALARRGVSRSLSGEADDAVVVTLKCADITEWRMKAICEVTRKFEKIYF
jgi:hypothetical protein